MIKANGVVAVFRGKSKYSKAKKEWVGNRQIDVPDGEYLFESRVVAWNDDGCPLIVGDRGLSNATDRSNFVGIREVSDESARVVSFVPASDWIAWRFTDGQWWPSRLCAWALLEDGSITPMEPDSDGLVMKTEDGARILHASDAAPTDSPIENED